MKYSLVGEKVARHVREGQHVIESAIDWERQLKAADELPTSPIVAMRVLDAIHAVKVSQAELEAVAVLDPALSLKLLQLANSSLFGAVGRIGSLGHALARLELHAARLTLLGFHLLDQEQMPAVCRSYWRRCRATAIACRKLAKLFPEANSDEAEVVGLIANLGLLLYLKSASEADFADQRQGESELFAEAAQATENKFGLPHAQLAAKLFARWNLPEGIVRAVDAFLDVERLELLPGRDRELARLLHVADGFVGASISGRLADANHHAGLLKTWARLGNEAVDSFRASLGAEIAEVEALFAPQPYSAERLIGAARREMMDLSIVAASDLARIARREQESLRQIDRLQKQRDLLERQVTTDPLTGIGNRKFFDQRIAEELERAKRHRIGMALIMFDLDRFKQLNDEHGHIAGDEVLRQIAAAVRKCLRSSDIFTRYGGEEFAVIAPETDLDGAMASAQRMRKCLEDMTIETEGKQLKITASFGVACLRDTSPIERVEDFLREADRHLYQAKHDGRNLVRGGLA